MIQLLTGKRTLTIPIVSGGRAGYKPAIVKQCRKYATESFNHHLLSMAVPITMVFS
jgi:hypothetical protein